MGRIIALGIIVIVIIILLLFFGAWIYKKRLQREAVRSGYAARGDLSGREEKQLLQENADAADLLRHLLAPPTHESLVEDLIVLPAGIRMAASVWLTRYNKRKALRP